MTTNIDKEKEKQQENEKKQLYIRDLEQFDREQREREMQQAFNYYAVISKEIHELATEIINEWINKNFIYRKGNIYFRKRAKLSNKWVLLIFNMYNIGIIEYDKEKKKFIINIEP
jgi:hypothetical protein